MNEQREREKESERKKFQQKEDNIKNTSPNNELDD